MSRTAYSSEETAVQSQTVMQTREASLLDVLVALVKHKRTILFVTTAASLASLVVAFILPVKYTAIAKLLPPAQNQSGALAALGQLSGFGATSLLGNALNLKNTSDVYVAMLKSRTLQDRLIERFDLRQLYKKKTYADARTALQDNTRITTGKEGVITLEFEDRDAHRAKDIAAAYLEELLALSETLAVSEAAQRRLYFERQLEKQKTKLADAEVELKRTQQSTGLIVPAEQARAIIEGIARVQAMIASKEVEISAMRSYATEQNPQVIQVQNELRGLKSQLRVMEEVQPKGAGTSFISAGKVPEAALQFVRKYRDFKYHETLFEVLAKQYEAARLDEAKDLALLQALDQPVVPDKKSKPYRGLIVSMSTLTALLLACLFAYVLESRKGASFAPEDLEKILFIRTHWFRNA